MQEEDDFAIVELQIQQSLPSQLIEEEQPQGLHSKSNQLFVPEQVRKRFIVTRIRDPQNKFCSVRQPEHYKGKVINWALGELIEVKKRPKNQRSFRSLLGLLQSRWLIIEKGYLYSLVKTTVSVYQVKGITPLNRIDQIYAERDGIKLRIVVRKETAFKEKDFQSKEREKLLNIIKLEAMRIGLQITCSK